MSTLRLYGWGQHVNVSNGKILWKSKEDDSCTEKGDAKLSDFHVATHPPVPVEISDFDEETHVQNVSSGRNHALFLTSNGRVYGVGRCSEGQLGRLLCCQSNLNHSLNAPTSLSEFDQSDVISCSVNLLQSVLLCKNGQIIQCGIDINEKEDDDDDDEKEQVYQTVSKEVIASHLLLYPKPKILSSSIDKTEKMVCVVAGSHHWIALSQSGRVYTWGRGAFGNLGHGTSELVKYPKRIQSMETVNIRYIAAGEDHSILISDRGRVYSFGNNTCGQLGTGGTVNRFHPTLVKSLIGVNCIKASCGSSFTLGLTDDGILYGMGDTSYGQLTISPSKQSLTISVPQKLDSFSSSKLVDIQSGDTYSVAMCRESKIYVWGLCGSFHSASPQLINLYGVVKQVFCGSNHMFFSVLVPDDSDVQLQDCNMSVEALKLQLKDHSIILGEVCQEIEGVLQNIQSIFERRVSDPLNESIHRNSVSDKLEASWMKEDFLVLRSEITSWNENRANLSALLHSITHHFGLYHRCISPINECSFNEDDNWDSDSNHPFLGDISDLEISDEEGMEPELTSGAFRRIDQWMTKCSEDMVKAIACNENRIEVLRDKVTKMNEIKSREEHYLQRISDMLSDQSNDKEFKRAKVEDILPKLGHLVQENQKYKKRIKRLEDKTTRQNQELSDLRELLRELEVENIRLIDRLKEYEEPVREGNNNDLKNEDTSVCNESYYVDVQSALGEMRETRLDLELSLKNEKLETRIETLTMKLESANDTIHRLQTDISLYKGEAEKRGWEKEQLSNTYRQIKQENEDLNTLREELSRDNLEQLAALVEVKTQMTHIFDKLRNLYHNLKHNIVLTSLIGKATIQSLDNSSIVIPSIPDQCDLSNYDVFMATIIQLSDMLASIAREVNNDLKSQLDVQISTHPSDNSINIEKDGMLEVYRSEMQRSLSLVKEYENEITMNGFEMQSLKNELNSMKSVCESLQESIRCTDTLNNDYSQLKEMYQSLLKSHQENLIVIEELNAQLANNRNDLSRAHSDLSTQSQFINEQLGELQVYKNELNELFKSFLACVDKNTEYEYWMGIILIELQEVTSPFEGEVETPSHYPQEPQSGFTKLVSFVLHDKDITEKAHDSNNRCIRSILETIEIIRRQLAKLMQTIREKESDLHGLIFQLNHCVTSVQDRQKMSS